MIRNRPSTMAAMTSTTSALPTDDNNVETPHWTTTINEDVHDKKSSINRTDHNHPTDNNRNSSTNNSNNSDDNTKRYPVREIQIYIRGLQDPIVINPMVSFYAILILWSVVIWTIGT
jgi:hypothetical protein